MDPLSPWIRSLALGVERMYVFCTYNNAYLACVMKYIQGSGRSPLLDPPIVSSLTKLSLAQSTPKHQPQGEQYYLHTCAGRILTSPLNLGVQPPAWPSISAALSISLTGQALTFTVAYESSSASPQTHHWRWLIQELIQKRRRDHRDRDGDEEMREEPEQPPDDPLKDAATLYVGNL